MKDDTLYTIAISGFFGDDNVGDDLLQLAVIDGIKKHLRAHKIVVFTSNVEKNINLFKRERLNHNSLDIVYSGRWGLKEPNRKNLGSYSWIIKNLQDLRKCDLHLIGPGNIIKDNTNRFLATFWILRGFLSHLLGKPFALFAVGVADVNHYHSKYIIKKLLNKARFITTRDNTSLEKLRQLKVNAPPMDSFPDLTYTLINRGKRGEHEKTGEIKTVGLNFANFSQKFFPYAVIENYKKVVVEFLKKLAENNSYELIFFPFSGVSHFNDNIMYEFVADEMKRYNRHICRYSYKSINELKEKIARCDVFVGTRFHSIVFAIQGGVPTVAMSYDWKARNFLSEAGLGDYTLRVSDLTIEKLIGAWNNMRLNYIDYFGYLKELNKKYYRLSLKHFDTLRNFIHKQG